MVTSPESGQDDGASAPSLATLGRICDNGLVFAQMGGSPSQEGTVDGSVVKLVVLAVFGITISAVVGTVVLVATGHEPPQALGWIMVAGFSFEVGIPINPRNGGGQTPTGPSPQSPK